MNNITEEMSDDDAGVFLNEIPLAVQPYTYLEGQIRAEDFVRLPSFLNHGQCDDITRRLHQVYGFEIVPCWYKVYELDPVYAEVEYELRPHLLVRVAEVLVEVSMSTVQTYVVLAGQDAYADMEAMQSWFYAEGVWWPHNYYPDVLFTTFHTAPC